MELRCIRKIRQTKATISEFLINGNRFCHILEDVDRGLDSQMPLKKLLALKQPHITAIPTGRYQVVLSYSPHFKKILPRVLGVPAYDGILQHAGNTDLHTDGCQILGDWDGDQDFIHNSRNVMEAYIEILERAEERGETVWLNVEREYTIAA